ncbi:efflux RND transporter periplasmic adaptor subunit [Paracidovorax anthurii]|uniref:Multidrug efflux system membrane fusion protein n=1 Tax=Paracidovorax anthurii TaxID=78229 RepID=A0A328ZIG6_9BURK|nr:efflux RND transporter periplasmic adaptor subunit [Paracidovorax anthurii]RAR85374.1 multidrug efflux system membrane fusion protein [Paracidovorax anthurii]
MKIDFPPRLGCMSVLVAAMLAGCGAAEPETAVPPPVVSVMTVSAANLKLTEDLPGRVAAVRVAEIRPQVSGIVQRRLFEQGTEVRAGQGLFQINPAPFKADLDTAAATLQRAEAVLARARTQAARLQPLVEADAVSGQVYDDAVSQRDQAAADVAQARATLARKRLDLKFALVEAPISGRIDQALVTEGALVGSSDANPMARIQQIDQVYVDVRRPASSLEALREALSGKQEGSGNGLPVTVLRSNGEPYGVKGRILFSGVNVDAGTGDVLLRILVDNPQRQLLPGMFVRARVPHTRYAEALTVPQQAVVRVAGQPQVWTLDAQGQAHRKPIELGELADRSYRVRSGLSAGQKVVVEGMERLADGAPVTARDWKLAEAIATEQGPQAAAASVR